MRRFALVLCVAAIAGCTGDTQDDEMAPDSAAMAPAPPAGISLADVNGTWNVNVMPMDRDTVVATYVLTGADSTWSFTFPGRDPIPMHIISVAGDSIMTHTPPFQSEVRKAQNVMVESTGVMRLQNGMLVGTTVAHYKVTTPDSVVTFRIQGTRAN